MSWRMPHRNVLVLYGHVPSDPFAISTNNLIELGGISSFYFLKGNLRQHMFREVHFLEFFALDFCIGLWALILYIYGLIGVIAHNRVMTFDYVVMFNPLNLSHKSPPFN